MINFEGFIELYLFGHLRIGFLCSYQFYSLAVRLPSHADLVSLLHLGALHLLQKRIKLTVISYQEYYLSQRIFRKSDDIILKSWRSSSLNKYEGHEGYLLFDMMGGKSILFVLLNT